MDSYIDQTIRETIRSKVAKLIEANIQGSETIGYNIVIHYEANDTGARRQGSALLRPLR